MKMQLFIEKKRIISKDVFKERMDGMAGSWTSLLENLKHIFGIVYSDTPPESAEESEENED